MEDEILELNIQIHNLVFCIGQKERDELPDIRDLKDKEDEYAAWDNLTDLKDKLEEAIDLIDFLRMNYEYD